MLLELGAVHVGFAVRFERLDRRADATPTAVRHALAAPLLLGQPLRLHAQPGANLVVRDPDDVLAAEIARRAVEQHRRVDEGFGFLLPVVRDRRDDREAGHGPGVGDFDFVLLTGRHDTQRAVALARHVYARALRALVADDVTVDQRVDVALEVRRELLLVGERHVVLHDERLFLLLRHYTGSHA